MTLPETWRVDPVDCVEAMRGLPECSVDAVVTDPPYGLEFMGKEWDGADGFRRGLNVADVERDSVFGRTSRTSPQYRTGVLYQEWTEVWAAEALRILKPGGHLLAFSAPRTYHRMAVAIEDAGFEIRDMVEWIYGTGFPKSLDVSKAIDKAAGAERAPGVPGPYASRRPREETQAVNAYADGVGDAGSALVTEPATAAAAAWAGWGTALKPAHEPIVLARKPLSGTVAGNVLEHGVGALNVDECRVATDEDTARTPSLVREDSAAGFGKGAEMGGRGRDGGRWPANVILGPDAAADLDESSPETASKKGKPRRSEQPGEGWGMTATGAEYDDRGGPSRFFYVAKPSRKERDAGTDKNIHPTVKPVALMRYLCRLVTPPGGIVLDPFVGSGTTGCAAVMEGLRFLGFEMSLEYVEIARARISHWGAEAKGVAA